MMAKLVTALVTIKGSLKEEALIAASKNGLTEEKDGETYAIGCSARPHHGERCWRQVCNVHLAAARRRAEAEEYRARRWDAAQLRYEQQAAKEKAISARLADLFGPRDFGLVVYSGRVSLPEDLFACLLALAEMA